MSDSKEPCGEPLGSCRDKYKPLTDKVYSEYEPDLWGQWMMCGECGARKHVAGRREAADD